MQSDRPPMHSEQFGPLQGVRIISSGTIIAQPFAAGMAAEMGAEVIHIERPKLGDIWRNVEFAVPTKDGGAIAAGWMQTQRNTYDITLDLSTPRGKEIFLQLVSQADIWMESSIPGTYKEWGLDDETVHKVNPKLVIAHVSGYGQTGHPDYLERASYDMIGQAFGGLMNLTGFPDPEPPVRAAPWTGDFITALFCLWSSLAAYVYAQRTGQGQSIDLAQYEAVHHVLGGTMVAYYELGLDRTRSGNAAGLFQPYDCFPAKDGWVVIATVGSVFDRVCRVIGLDPDEDDWRTAHTDLDSIKGIEFNAILRGWIEDRTVKEVVDAMNAARVGCTAIMTPKDMAEDPHYEMRDMHIEWDDINVGRKIKGVGITPKMSLTPGQIWRGSVPMGYDNDTVLGNILGLDAAEIDGLREQGII